MPREEEPRRPPTPAPRGLTVVYLLLVLLPLLLLLALLGSLPAPG